MLYFDRAAITVHVSSMNRFYTFSTSDVNGSRLFDDKHIIKGFFHFNVYDVPSTGVRGIPYFNFDLNSSYLTHMDFDFTKPDVPRIVFYFEPPFYFYSSIIHNFDELDLDLDSEDSDLLSDFIDCTIY